MSQPTLLLLVKFKSPLSLEEVQDVVNSRLEDFRALEGLQQKYYLVDAESGEFAGLYLWETAEAMSEYRESELRESIGKAYRTEGPPRIEVFHVFEILRD